MTKKNNFKYVYMLSVLTVVVSMFACSSATTPNEIRKIAWLPPDAQIIKSYKMGATQQLKYSVNVCYPAQDFIDNLVGAMRAKNWIRQDTDFLNPGLNLNHKRGSGLWSHLVDDKESFNLYRWTEDFEDSAGNILRYWLQYKVKQNVNGNNKAIQINSCNLEVLVIYYPKEARH